MAPSKSRFLHLKEIRIGFSNGHPGDPILVRIHINDNIYVSKVYAKLEPVVWSCGIYVSSSSHLTLEIIRIRWNMWKIMVKRRIAEIILAAGDPGVKENSLYSCSDSRQRVQAELTFSESVNRETVIDLLGKDVRCELASKIIFLDRVKNISTFTKIVLEVGSALSEFNGPAKVVFELANRLFKMLQDQQEFHDMATDLADLLNVKLHLSYIVPEKLRQGNVQKSLKDLLDTIEEVLNFIKKCMDSFFSNVVASRREELTELKAKLSTASENFALCLTAEVFVMVSDVHTNMQDTLLEKKLRPVLPARASAGHSCLEGTRELPLRQIIDWVQSVDSSFELYHLHGVAGSGKSSMVASACERLEEEGTLAGAFHCKRDIPDQRDPNRILPSLSYTLALRHKSYRESVARRLEDEPDITSRSIEHQLKILFREPLAELPKEIVGPQAKPFVFVVDALDECGDELLRIQIADCLYSIATLNRWLKVVVSSRPLDELMRSLKPSPSRKILSVDLNAHDAGDDIKAYTRVSMTGLVNNFGLDAAWLGEDTIDKLTAKASGLFVWSSTMISFVRSQLDKDEAMRLVLSGDVSAAEESLDSLYTKIIESSGSDRTNLALKKTVLGVIVVTARNRPLSIDGLYDFLQGMSKRVSKPTLVAAINHLRSVLYEDTSKGNVIRVCHPSFLDFLENPERSGVYWIDVEQLHAAMIETSLKIMNTKLKFNICGLETSYVANADIADLPQRIKDNIPESLEYSCLYWTSHLSETNWENIEYLVFEFLQGTKGIYWIEALTLIGDVRGGVNALQKVMDFSEGNKTIYTLANDLYRLVSSSYDAINHSTPHLYVSVLAWLPEESLLRNSLPHISSSSLISTGRKQRWQSTLWMYNFGDHTHQVKFSPDNKHVAACSINGSIIIFEVKTGLPKIKLRIPEQQKFRSITFSPDGRRLVSGSVDGSVIMWDARSGETVGDPLFGHTGTVSSVAYSPDGHFLATRSDDKVLKIWDVASSSVLKSLEGCTGFGRVVFSPDGSKIACCGEEGVIILDAHTGDLIDTLSNLGRILDVVYSPNGKYLVACGILVYIWEADTLTELAVLTVHSNLVYSVCFSPDSKVLVSASNDGMMIRWNMDMDMETSVRFQMTGVAIQEASVWSVSYSPDSQLFASASRDGGVRVWKSDQLFYKESPEVMNRLSCVASSPTGSEFVSAADNGDVRVHDVDSGVVRRTFGGHGGEVNTVAYSPDGTLLASGSDDGTIRVWDLTSGVELYKLEGHEYAVLSLVFLPDGKHIISTSLDGTLQRWTITSDVPNSGRTGTGTGTVLQSHTTALSALSLHPSGNLLAFGGTDPVITFTNPLTGEIVGDPITTVVPTRVLAFSTNGKLLASGSEDNLIRLFSVHSRSELRRFEGHTNFVLSLMFSQDGEHLLSSSGDNTIRQWCVRTGTEVRRLVGHVHSVRSAIYTPDEKRIISCSDDGTVRIWNANPGPGVEGSQRIAGIDRELSELDLKDGWIRIRSGSEDEEEEEEGEGEEEGKLVLWVPPEYRNPIRDMCEVCIPADALNHPVRLDWTKLVKGESWTDVFRGSENENE